MPQQKDFKRVVRTRMQKTGESYTTARLHLVRKQEPAEPVAPPEDYAALAKLSDESVKKATGCDWSKWVFVLDKAGGKEMSHPELVAYIREKYKTPGWWTQMVAVGYERIRGLRAQGQMRSGDWSVTKSKTINVPGEALRRLQQRPNPREVAARSKAHRSQRHPGQIHPPPLGRRCTDRHRLLRKR